MNLVKPEIEWVRDHSCEHVAFTASGKVDDGHGYVLVVAFSKDHACWTSFVALGGIQIHMAELEEKREAQFDACEALKRALRIRS